MERLMSPSGSPKHPRREVLSSTSTFRESSRNFYLPIDRDSVGSIYHDYCHDLADDGEAQQTYQPYHPYQPCQSYQPDPRSHIQSLRPASVLPAAQSEYCHHQSWQKDDPTYHSAPLHQPPWPSKSSSLCQPLQTTFLHSNNKPNRLQRNGSFATRSVTPVAVQTLCEKLDIGDHGYRTFRQSSDIQPSTPASSLLPSVLFSSTNTSPSSIKTYGSSQEMSQTYGLAEHFEEPKEKRKVLPKRLALGYVQPRNISSPIPSPTFLDVHGDGAASHPRLALSPSPALITSMEVSMFDDSDDEEGKFSHHVKKIKSAVSLQNLHNKSRARAESTARHAPPLPTPSPSGGWTNNKIAQRGGSGSLRPRDSKESTKSASPTVAAAPFDGQSTSPVARLQKKLTVRRTRSNTVSSIPSAPSPPPNTAVPPTPKLTQDRRQSRMSWYQCFSRAEPLDYPSFVVTKPKERRSKTSKKSNRGCSPGKVRIFFTKVFRLRK